MRFDIYGLDWLDNAANYSAGIGDNLSFGLTNWARNQLGINGGISHCSGWYKGGELTGIGIGIVAGGAAGAGAAELHAGEEGFEFSHWIPGRMGGPRSVFNGNNVSQEFHYLTDPFRYPSGWQEFGSKLPAAAQQLLRVPWVYGGAAAGGAYGGASAASNGSKCGCP